MDVRKRNNVQVKGAGSTIILFVHGFGCDQHMWRHVAPAFENDYTVVLFDHVGSGGSDVSAYDPEKYNTLDGYASDLVEIAASFNSSDIIIVGHSVSAMIGAMAAVAAPDLFSALVMVSPSPSYINEGDYVGGFTQEQVDELLESLENNHLGWSVTMAPVIMGNPDRKELGEELTQSFCRMEPSIARQFARTTFLTDKRAILPEVQLPVLILQCAEDIIAPRVVGEYVHKSIPDSQLVLMKATGHCPNLSAPIETIEAIQRFLND